MVQAEKENKQQRIKKKIHLRQTNLTKASPYNIYKNNGSSSSEGDSK